MKPKAIIFDIDGTLCELGDSANPYNHDGEEVRIQFMYFIYAGLLKTDYCDIIILTGRKDKDYRKMTDAWLIHNSFFYDLLIMQGGSTAEKNHIFKEKELIKLQEQYDIIAMFDDNQDLIPVCKRLGIPLLHVNI